MSGKRIVLAVAGLVGIAGLANAEQRPIHFVDLESNEVVEVRIYADHGAKQAADVRMLRVYPIIAATKE